MKIRWLISIFTSLLFVSLLALVYTQRSYLYFLTPVFAAVGDVRIAGSYATFSGTLRGTQFIDNDNNTYLLDPNATGNSLIVAGSVGIGTTVPGYILDVKGAALGTSFAGIDIQDTAAERIHIGYQNTSGVPTNNIVPAQILWSDAIGGGDLAGSLVIASRGNAASGIAFHTSAGTSLAERVRIDRNGNVGIGTTSPSEQLDVAGDIRSSTGTLQVGSTANLAFNRFGTGGSIVGFGGTGQGDLLVSGRQEVAGNFYVDGTTYFGGNVGIGTISPAYTLDIGGGSEKVGIIYRGHGTTGLTTILNDDDNSILFGWASPCGSGFRIKIDATCSSGYFDLTSWVNGSSREIKENFTPIDKNDVLTKIDAMPISKWSYKKERSYRKDSSTIYHIGPTAEDFSDAFHLGSDRVSISTVDSAGVALVGIQALNEKVEAQAKQIEELKKTVESLKVQIHQ